jgi:phage terminase large subunit-like protein
MPVAAEALVIPPEHLAREYHCTPEEVALRAIEVWLTSDANKKGRVTSDDSSIMVVARCDDGYYILDRVARPMGIVEYTRVMDAMIDRWAPALASKGGVLIEDTANGATYLETSGRFRSGVTMHDFMPTRDTPGTDKSKEARGDYVVKAAAATRIVLPSARVAAWGPQLRERLLGWPAIGRDDMDALSQLVMKWSKEAAGSWSIQDMRSYLGL